MPTAHIEAEYGQIAKTVLMPGDPLRAKFISDKFLSDAKLFNSVRNILGYTGEYKGKRISVMASGMGMPSIGIYSYELFKFYDVENIIRIGSCGAFDPKLKLFDVLLVDEVYSNSTFAKVQNGSTDTILLPSDKLNEKIISSAKKLKQNLIQGRVLSSDVFYAEEARDYFKENKCLAVEMESFALFHNAKVLGKNTACLLTVSDSIVNKEETTAQERQTAFLDMMEIALNTDY